MWKSYYCKVQNHFSIVEKLSLQGAKSFSIVEKLLLQGAKSFFHCGKVIIARCKIIFPYIKKLSKIYKKII